VLGAGFVFNGLTAQHRAILQRRMRFTLIATIDMISLTLGVGAAVALAATGFRYWALVAMTIVPQACALIGCWIATGWKPGPPQRKAGVRSMLVYGGTVTLNGLIVYIAYNADKVLLGRFWGAEALGMYGRAYQLLTIPMDVLNTSASQVAFPSLSRLTGERERLRNYFMRGYGLLVAILLPIYVACAIYSEDIIHVFLGSKWHDAAGLFRMLTPVMLVFTVINPFGWLMQATGYSVRSMNIALLIAPVVITGYALGLPYGAMGVAMGFSVAMLLLTIPIIAWVKRDMPFTTRDIVLHIAQPAIAAVVAAVVALASEPITSRIDWTFLRLVVESAVLMVTYLVVLLIPARQRATYIGLFRELKRKRPSA
jgi:O-antigen/teichoic acid export membrane protein